MSTGSEILTLATKLQDQSRRLSSTRENFARTYKTLEKLVARLAWRAQMDNQITSYTAEEQATYKANIAGDDDRFLTRAKEILAECGIAYRSMIGVSNALNLAGKELLAITAPQLAELVNQNLSLPSVSGLSEDSTKASPHQAAAAEARAEAAADITNESNRPAANLAGPTL